MQTTLEMIKYQFRVSLRSPKFVMPLALLMAFLCVIYAVAPVGVVDSFTVTAVCIFYIMAWAGFSFQSLESPVTEQLLILKLNSQVRFCVCRCLFLLLLGLLVSALSLLYPIAANAVNQFQLFNRPLTVPDAASALVLFWSASCMGAAVGSLLHPRIMRDRKIALLLTAFIAIAALAKEGIVQRFPLAGVLTWLLPPLSDTVSLFKNAEQYTLPAVAAAAAMMAGYGVLLNAVQIFILNKRKF